MPPAAMVLLVPASVSPFDAIKGIVPLREMARFSGSAENFNAPLMP